MARALFSESVADAAALAGGCERLAAELGVSAAEVESWRAGTSVPEDAVFLRIIEFTLRPAAPVGRPLADACAHGEAFLPGSTVSRA